MRHARRHAAIDTTGMRLGLASEGSFNPHPTIPFLAAGRELILLIDAEEDIVIEEAMISEETNFDYLGTEPASDLDGFLDRIGFPSHAVIARPNDGSHSAAKGIVTRPAVDRAISDMAACSVDGLARIETDMRAHLNPTRMSEIGKLANRFAQRLATLCPACVIPGFGIRRTQAGLPCSDCGTPTHLVNTILCGCARCSYETLGPRSDSRIHASPAECPECNP